MSQVKYYDTGSSQWVAAIVGAQGAQGTAGFVGSNGANGAQGFQGVQGLQGIQGPTGLQGIQGPFNPTAAKTVATFTATAGQTTFTTSYTVGYIDVYLNGVRLSGADYTATNGTSVVIATALNAGDTVDVVQYTMGQGIQGIQGVSGAGVFLMWRYTASGGETTLSGTDGFSTTLTYTVGAEQVFVNGVLLERGVDYAATTGTSITGLTALVAGDVATIVSHSSFSFANAIPVSTVTAKGDLIAATGASTVTNLAVGADGSTLVANSSASTGVSWAGNYVAGKNKIINGAFDVWQRGTSFTNPAAGSYTADRFVISYDNAPSSASVTQVAFDYASSPASDKLPISGYNSTYFLRSTITTVGSTTVTEIQQRIENVRTFAGQTVTLSFWAKADSARSSIVYLFQNSAGTGSAYSSTPTLNVTTSWQRYSFTFTLGSVSGFTIGANSSLYAVIRQACASGSVLDIWGMQLEAGSVATSFQTATGTLQGELQACQRYAYRMPQSGNAIGILFQAQSTTTAIAFPAHPVTMRTSPSVTFGGTWTYTINGVDTASSAMATSTIDPNYVQIEMTTTSLVAGQAGRIRGGNYLASAEL